MKISPYVLLVVLMVAMTPSSDAMDQPTYDLDSLLYYSTDIVIATLVDASSSPLEAPTETVVIAPLHGSLHSGDKLPGLNYQLDFFSPRLSTGEKFILFLDHNPRQATFGEPYSETIPYTILPGGLYRIDDHQHVHIYYQEQNPGPYEDEIYGGAHRFAVRQTVALNLSMSVEAQIKAQEEAKKNWEEMLSRSLPTLYNVEREIAKHLPYVDSLRVLLDKKPAAGDISALLSLLKTRHYNDFFNDSGTDAILDKIISNLVAIGDRPSLIEAYQIQPDYQIQSYFDGRYSADKNYLPNSMSYLSKVLSSEKEETSTRICAAALLHELYRYYFPHESGPIITKLTDDIHTEAENIFTDPAESIRLRIVCLEKCLDSSILGDAKLASKVYLSTESTSLKFAIEEAFLRRGEFASYEALHPPCGPVSSLVSISSEREDLQRFPHAGFIRFWVKYHQEEKFLREFEEDNRYPHPRNALDQKEYFILTHRSTKSSSQFEPQRSSQGGYRGENYVDFAEKTDLPPGDYELAYQFSRRGKVVSTCYPLELTVVHTKSGNFIRVFNSE